MTKAILLIAIALIGSAASAEQWSTLNLTVALSTPEGSSVFCNGAKGKFNISLGEDGGFVLNGLQYGNLIENDKWIENQPCDYTETTVTCAIDSRRYVEIDVSSVEYNANNWDGPGNPGEQFEIPGTIKAGNFLSVSTEYVTCTL